MSILDADCPHCNKNTFISVGEIQHTDKSDFTVYFMCNFCQKGVMATIRYDGGATPHQYESGLNDKSRYHILEIYPKPEQVDVPLYTPDNVKSFYLQAAEALKNKHYDASGSMSRKVLDTSLKNLFPDITGTLYFRIETIADANKITQAMKAWAHTIRIDGNDAAHDEDPFTEKEAEDLLTFSKLFLMYSYTLPGMIEARTAPIVDVPTTDSE